MGKSETLRRFLTQAFDKRGIDIYIAETAPLYHGRQLAEQLISVSGVGGRKQQRLQHGVPVTLIPDANIFTIMANLNKVVIGAHAGTPALRRPSLMDR